MKINILEKRYSGHINCIAGNAYGALKISAKPNSYPFEVRLTYISLRFKSL